MAEVFRKRIRVFAGPNGSGKSTVVTHVKEMLVEGYPIDLGTVVNADEIAQALRAGALLFSDFDLRITPQQFERAYKASGLWVFHEKGGHDPKNWYQVKGNKIQVLSRQHLELIAQATAWVILQSLLHQGEKISFETVFSSTQKIELLKQAKLMGYKVYLYFVSTQNPRINVSRIDERVARGGHAVPVEKVYERYTRSLENLTPSLEHVYRAFIIDNTFKNRLLAQLYIDDEEKRHWDDVDQDNLPKWFIKYCVDHDPDLQAIITRNKHA